MKMRISTVWLTLVLAAAVAATSALTAGPAMGQVDTGAIRGTVTDSSGAVVANAKVTLKNEDTGFVGAAAIAQVRLFNTHPTGQSLKRERLSALMGDGGIQECGYAQNCIEVCPKDIPLTRSIAEVGGEVMKQAVGDLFRK